MPVREMMLFTSSVNAADPDFACCLLQLILRPLIPPPNRGYPHDNLDQESLVEWYLPHAAIKADPEINAKVTILIEALMRLWEKYKGLVYNLEFQKAVATGIAARYHKANSNKTTKKNHEEMTSLIETTATRMGSMMNFAKRRMPLEEITMFNQEEKRDKECLRVEKERIRLEEEEEAARLAVEERRKQEKKRKLLEELKNKKAAKRVA